MLQIISQVALCLLLILTTTWCVIVHRKLSHLRHDEGPLRELVQALNEATAHADQTIADMRTSIRDADRRAVALHELTQRLDRQTTRARAVQEEALRSNQAGAAPGAAKRTMPSRRPARTQTAQARKPSATVQARQDESARVDLAPDRLRLAKSIECLR